MILVKNNWGKEAGGEDFWKADMAAANFLMWIIFDIFQWKWTDFWLRDNQKLLLNKFENEEVKLVKN